MKLTLFLYFSVFTGMYATGQNVGIGTLTPSEKLDVSGNIRSAGTIKANNVQFNSPKTYYYSLSGADFVTKSSLDEIRREGITAGGAFFNTSVEGMVAAIHLPHGATVTKMTAIFFDDAIAVDMQVILRMNAGVQYLATITTSGTAGEGSLIDNTISNPVIDNSLRGYVIDAKPVGGQWPSSHLIIRRVIIEYELSQL